MDGWMDGWMDRSFLFKHGGSIRINNYKFKFLSLFFLEAVYVGVIIFTCNYTLENELKVFTIFTLCTSNY